MRGVNGQPEAPELSDEVKKEAKELLERVVAGTATPEESDGFLTVMEKCFKPMIVVTESCDSETAEQKEARKRVEKVKYLFGQGTAP